MINSIFWGYCDGVIVTKNGTDCDLKHVEAFKPIYQTIKEETIPISVKQHDRKVKVMTVELFF